VSHSVSRRHGQHFSLYVCVCVSCYGMALKQQPAVSSVWHDLGVCYYHVMKVVEGHQVKLMAGNCVISLKQALRLEPTNHCHWNALGGCRSSRFFILLFTGRPPRSASCLPVLHLLSDPKMGFLPHMGDTLLR